MLLNMSSGPRGHRRVGHSGINTPSTNRPVWWLLSCVTWTEPQSTQVFGQTLSWVSPSGCFRARWILHHRCSKVDGPLQCLGLIQSVKGLRGPTSGLPPEGEGISPARLPADGNTGLFRLWTWNTSFSESQAFGLRLELSHRLPWVSSLLPADPGMRQPRESGKPCPYNKSLR